MSRPTALVTGASSGIGLALSRILAKNGFDVVLVARTASKLQDAAKELQKSGVSADVIASDLSRPNAAADIVAELKRRNIEIEILVNNAGYGLAGPFVDNDLQRELDMIQVNIVALTQLTKLLRRPMVAQNRGRILNVASTAAFQPGPLMAVYYATKAYVLSFSEAIANELRHSGVTVTCFCPGATHTGFAARAGTEKSRLFKKLGAMSAEKVALDGYRAVMEGRTLAISGTHNWLVAQSTRLAPRKMVTAISRWISEKAE